MLTDGEKKTQLALKIQLKLLSKGPSHHDGWRYVFAWLTCLSYEVSQHNAMHLNLPMSACG